MARRAGIDDDLHPATNALQALANSFPDAPLIGFASRIPPRARGQGETHNMDTSFCLTSQAEGRKQRSGGTWLLLS